MFKDNYSVWLRKEAEDRLELNEYGAITHKAEHDYVSKRLSQTDRALYLIHQVFETAAQFEK